MVLCQFIALSPFSFFEIDYFVDKAIKEPSLHSRLNIQCGIPFIQNPIYMHSPSDVIRREVFATSYRIVFTIEQNHS